MRPNYISLNLTIAYHKNGQNTNQQLEITKFFTNFVLSKTTDITMTIYKSIYRSAVAIIMAAGICISSYATPISSQSEADPIEEINTQTPVLKVTSEGIEISNPGEENIHVSVYALTGQLVTQKTLPSGTSTVELKPGFYIIKYGNHTKRIAIK